jgi:MscS family membrane protein
MAPDFLVSLVGDQNLADWITRLGIILGLVIVFLIFRRLLLFLLQPIQHLLNKLVGEELGESVIRGIYPPLQFILTIFWIFVVLDLAQINFSPRVTEIGFTIGNALILVGIFWAIYRMVNVLALFLQQRIDLSDNDLLDLNTMRVANQIAEVVVVVIAFAVIMDEIGYNLNGLLAGVGLTGLAVALAAQAALANWIGYLSIISDSPFEIGDTIHVDEYEGVVEDLGFNRTRVRRGDQSLVSIPNKVLADSVIINWTRLSKRQAKILVRVEYDTPAYKLREAMAEMLLILQNDERVVHDGTEQVQFVDFGEWSLDIEVSCYLRVKTTSIFQSQKQEVLIMIMDVLDKYEVKRAILPG